MATYVISDIHGCFDLFQQLLEKIKFDSADTLLILGDNIDRGSQSLAVVDFIQQNNNVESLIGNHEKMMLDEIDGLLNKQLAPFNSNWLYNGGNAPLYEIEARENKNPGYLQKLKTEFKKWKYYKLLQCNGKTIICVHAEYRYNPKNSSDPEHVLRYTPNHYKVWVREEFIHKAGIPDTLTVFGHTPTPNITRNGGIWYDEKHKDKINIDCGAYKRRELGCLRLDDMAAFYVGSGRKVEILPIEGWKQRKIDVDLYETQFITTGKM